MDLKINMEFYNVSRESSKEDFPPEINGAAIAEIAGAIIDIKEEAIIVSMHLPKTDSLHPRMFCDLFRAVRPMGDNYLFYGQAAYLTFDEFHENSEYYDDTFITEPDIAIGKKVIDNDLVLPKAALFEKQDRKTLKKINSLLEDIKQNGALYGKGKPELLKHDKSVLYIIWIDETNHLVYGIDEARNIRIIHAEGIMKIKKGSCHESQLPFLFLMVTGQDHLSQ